MTKISKTFITHNGKRVGVNYFTGPWIGIDQATIKIRPRRGSTFPASFRDVFAVENNSDSQTDYFEADCIRVLPGHPLYDQVKAAATGRLAILRVYTRRYSDSGQCTAYVEWSDGSRTEGPARNYNQVPIGEHMRALFERALREGLTIGRETW